MHYISLIYHEVFYRPILNILVLLTSYIPWNDLGFSVILLTVFLRALIFPLTHKMIHTQHKMRKIEPELKKIQKEIMNREEQGRATMALYKKHGVNPFSGFLSIFIQFPLLFAMYKVFWTGLPFKTEEIYSFIYVPQHVNTMFLGLLDLALPSIALAAMAAISQFIQIKLATPPASPPASPNRGESLGGPQSSSAPSTAGAMQKQMLYIFPVMIFFIGFKLPAAVALYWTTMNIFAIVHEAIVRSQINGNTNTEPA